MIKPIDLIAVAALAAADFAASMRDDRQLWQDREITGEIIKQEAHRVACENAETAVRRELGKIVTPLTEALDVALTEDGALADFEFVAAGFVQQGPVDLSGFAAATDWESKLAVVGKALAGLASKVELPTFTVAELLAYVNSDQRLAGYAKQVSALEYPEAANVMPDMLKFLVRNAKPETPPADEWEDDEIVTQSDDVDPWVDDEAPQETAAQTEVKLKPGVPAFFQYAQVAGITDVDMATVLGVSKGYLSQLRNGKRPWPGLKPDQQAAIRKELESRVEHIGTFMKALSTPAIADPAGV